MAIANALDILQITFSWPNTESSEDLTNRYGCEKIIYFSSCIAQH